MADEADHLWAQAEKDSQVRHPGINVIKPFTDVIYNFSK
jgi:hypothetical protein